MGHTRSDPTTTVNVSTILTELSQIETLTLVNLIRRAVQNLGVTVRLALRTQLWRILLEADLVPDQRACLVAVAGVIKRYPQHPDVEIYGRATGDQRPAWGVRLPRSFQEPPQLPGLVVSSESKTPPTGLGTTMMAETNPLAGNQPPQRSGFGNFLNSVTPGISPLHNPSQFTGRQPTPTPTDPKPTSVQQVGTTRSKLANFFVVATGVGVIAFALAFLYTNATTVRSRDAVINGILVGVRAPEDGVILQLRGKVGDIVQPSDGPIALIENDRASRMEPKIITTWLEKRRGELEAEKEKLYQMQKIWASVQADATNQRTLEIMETQNQVAAAQASLEAAQENYRRTQADLEGAKSRERLARINDQRYAQLAKEGAVAQSLADGARAELEQSQANVVSRSQDVRSAAQEVQRLARNLDAQRAEQNAAKLGLTLRNTRSQFDPRLRLQELDTNIQQQQALVRGIQKEIASKEAELKQAQTELKQRTDVAVIPPITGIVWQFTMREGMQVQKNETMVQLLDCNRRWVDVFVDEKYLQLLRPGTKATIKLYGGDRQEFRATVTNIRSGLGRLNAGEDLVIPIPENYPRQSQVRVEFDSAGQQTQGNFCYVGYTAKVTFDVNNDVNNP